MKSLHTKHLPKMSNQSMQLTRASNVFPSDTVNIPYPNVVLESATSGSGDSSLVDATVDFLELGIKIGDSVYDPDNLLWGTVTSVSQNELGMSDSTFDSAGVNYWIYQGENRGCVLYVGTGGRLTVLTAGETTIELAGVQDGTFVPIKVLRVLASGTSCTDIIALW